MTSDHSAEHQDLVPSHIRSQNFTPNFLNYTFIDTVQTHLLAHFSLLVNNEMLSQSMYSYAMHI